MSNYRAVGRRDRTVMACASVLGLLLTTGCETGWWNAWLDPTQIGGFHQTHVQDIQPTISFRDKPMGIPGATDPTPDDLEAVVQTYKIGPGDVLLIRMFDFLIPDTESEFTPTVDELGYIVVPQLGWIYVEGMSAQDLQQELARKAKEAGIYRMDDDPTVIVNVVGPQQRFYKIDGAVAQPGLYRIPRPNFRLREAVLQSGGMGQTIKQIFVIRDEPRRERVEETAVHPTMSPAVQPEDEIDSELAPPPVSPSAFLMDAAGGPTGPVAGSTQKPRPGNRTPGLETSELEEGMRETVLGPGGRRPNRTLTLASSAQAQPDNGSDAPALPPFVFVNDHWEQSTTAVADEDATSEAQPPMDRPESRIEPDAGEVDWEEVVATEQPRIIRVPADRLRQGDNSLNIVIKHQDFIQVDPGPTGFFYLGGNVARPGTYALQGQEITLTQAIFSAGGLGPFAWPTRCEIRRRIDRDREEITQWNLERIVAGQDPDLFLKPHDVVNVGTHPVAPFLATIRNSFRMTYGFGFVYDRNFADIDAYFGQPNPKPRREAQLASRFPGLFP